MLHRVPEVTADDGAVLTALDEIRRELRHALARPRHGKGTLRRQARARAVRGSNSIEGIRVSEDEAFAIVGGEDDQVSVDDTWLAVKGYSDAMAHLNLVMIHPFADGDGRMSRIVQSLMLYREQVAEAEFVSIEEYLGQNTAAYHEVLARVGGGRWSPDRDAKEWLEFASSAPWWRQASFNAMEPRRGPGTARASSTATRSSRCTTRQMPASMWT